LKVYNWTEKNDNFLHADQDGIAIGCDDSYGLFISSELTYGYSNSCETFDNPRFTPKDRFEMKYFEVWTLDVD